MMGLYRTIKTTSEKRQLVLRVFLHCNLCGLAVAQEASSDSSVSRTVSASTIAGKRVYTPRFLSPATHSPHPPLKAKPNPFTA